MMHLFLGNFVFLIEYFLFNLSFQSSLKDAIFVSSIFLLIDSILINYNFGYLLVVKILSFTKIKELRKLLTYQEILTWLYMLFYIVLNWINFFIILIAYYISTFRINKDTYILLLSYFIFTWISCEFSKKIGIKIAKSK